MNLILARKYRYKNRNKIGIILISIVINTLHEGANAMGVTSTCISIYNESMAVIMLFCPSESIYSTDLGEWGPILFACHDMPSNTFQWYRRDNAYATTTEM